MSNYHYSYCYVPSGDAKLFTVLLLPADGGKFPTVIWRSPYVDNYENISEDAITVLYLKEYLPWLQHGYAAVIQHCRGRGKSEGDCIPYIHEREDGLCLQDFVRKQTFYNGEIFLNGNSYFTSVHYATAPFAPDIKGAVFGIQDSERYNICYRNGFLKKGLHGGWYVNMYKAKSHMKKNYTFGSFDMLPLRDFTKTVFGEPAPDFDGMLASPEPDAPFWQTRAGGSDARGATDHVDFPVLFTTGFYDLYTGGIFDMWKKMHADSKARSALLVSPYDHGDKCDPNTSITFPNGKRVEQFGKDYEIAWFDYIRGKISKPPFEVGKITYYRLFENKWDTALSVSSEKKTEITLGENAVSYVYNPYDAPSFPGGLSRAFGGTVFQDKPNSRHDIISLYTEPFARDVFVKGKMAAALSVSSDCEDTCFYMRISIETERGDYGLRDDITSLCRQLGTYSPHDVVKLTFDFDEHAFLIKAGQRLRIDIASADNAHYVRHTNQKGLYSAQTTAKIAHNTVYLCDSRLVLPIE